MDEESDSSRQYKIRVFMRLIMEWGFTPEEIAKLLEIDEEYIVNLLRPELKKVKFQ